MFTLLSYLKTFLSLFARRPADALSPADQDYLDAAVDIYDLERRMRAIDDGHRRALSQVSFGLYIH